MDSYKIISDVEKSHILSLSKKGQRIDGRGFNDFREISLESDYVPKAEGSAKISLGNTQIIAGIKISIGTPYPDTPNSGVITVNAELSPMAAPHFEPGPPGEVSVEVARVVDRGIRHSDIIDKEKLAIIPGEKVFIIFCDLYVISYDGNMFDAGELGAVKALCTAKIPKLKVKDGEVKVIDEWHPLEIEDYPVSVTIANIGGALLVDPNANEQRVLDSRITLALNAKNEIVSAQKGGKGSFTMDEITKSIEIAQDIAPKLREYYK
ncbi:MAG: exosome complex protein Rrp42 [Candidatus Helarchaeota archaeon]|nr:exosome complex protein Rrp42 [Candidatus Helarchaeota archaeon]